MIFFECFESNDQFFEDIVLFLLLFLVETDTATRSFYKIVFVLSTAKVILSFSVVCSCDTTVWMVTTRVTLVFRFFECGVTLNTIQFGFFCCCCAHCCENAKLCQSQSIVILLSTGPNPEFVKNKSRHHISKIPSFSMNTQNTSGKWIHSINSIRIAKHVG